MSFTLNTKRILLLTFLFGLIILAGCTKGVKVTSLSFEKDSVVMFEGDDLALDVTVEPANATNVVLEWSSSNPSVVSVTQAGLASAVGVGEAVITVKFDGKSATLNIEVKKQGFNVSFDSFGGTEVATQVVEENSKAIKPDNPTKEGHVFVAWFDETMTNQFNFNTPITADITLYAKYNVLNYLVTFNPDNGDVAFSQRVDYGEKLVGVPTITKVGYIFDGWYEGEVKFDLNSPISKNTVLKAEWIAKEDTPYVVKHFVYNELSKEFDLDHTDNLTGTTGATVEVNLRTYPGLMPEEDSYSATILGDGSLVIEVYYVEYSFSLEYKLNGGNFTYETREEMVEDFLADYNAFNNSKYTVTTLPMGAWVNTNFHTFLYTPQYREKWLWIPIYLSVVGSSTNKAACADVVKYDTSSGFTGASANWIYALSYEIRGFIAGRKYTENANWMSSDYSEYDLANGFWPTFVAEHEETLIKGLKEPITLVSEAYRDGYLFDGWYVNADLSGDPVTEIKKDAVVYAKWKINNPVTEIVISNGVSSLEKYDELQLNITINPSNAYNKNLSYKSSNEKVLSISDTGLITAKNAGTATITIEAVMGGASTTLTIEVVPQDSLDIRFVTDDFNGTLEVNEEIGLKVSGLGAYSSAVATYKSLNPTIVSVSTSGVIKGLALGVGSVEVSVSGEVIATVAVNVIAPLTSTRLDSLLALLIANNEAVVDTANISLYYDDHSSFQQYFKSTYGSVNFYLFDDMNIDRTTYLVTSANGAGKFGGVKASTEFITVHDTANISGGLLAHGNYWMNPSTETSIHFTVGDYGVLQNLGTQYVGYHAGDGTSAKFSYDDTGVKANGNLDPVIDISTDGYYTFNGEKSTIVAPKGNSGQILDKSYFTYLGPNWKIGDNGNYYLGKTWFTTSQVSRGVISSYGGNNNSTGIEMCVNTGADMYDTWQRTAKLVATLLEEHNLGYDRVVQHNTFTGKNCPQSIFGTEDSDGGNYWDRFMKFVVVEHEILTKYADATITFVSHDPTLLSNTGRVIGRPTTTTTVSYTISVKIGEESKSITLSSIIPGISTWSQYDGFFATR